MACTNVSHTAQPNERCKVICNELRTVVADNLGARLWILLFRFDLLDVVAFGVGDKNLRSDIAVLPFENP